MATGSDRILGLCIVATAGLLFAYYTIWVIFLPFVDADHVIHNLFLPRVYAITIPIVAGVIALGCLGVFVGLLAAGKKKQN
ncbi:dolichol phosphate-mannose biosynthesis regulatory protein-like [Saccoglossus kowalevskii]